MQDLLSALGSEADVEKLISEMETEGIAQTKETLRNSQQLKEYEQECSSIDLRITGGTKEVGESKVILCFS